MPTTTELTMEELAALEQSEKRIKVSGELFESQTLVNGDHGNEALIASENKLSYQDKVVCQKLISIFL